MSCQVFPEAYQQQLSDKVARIQEMMPALAHKVEVFASETHGYRMRAEFRVWHIGDTWHYTMFDRETKKPIFIEDCPMVCDAIRNLMQPLRALLLAETGLCHKLYAIDFLASTLGEVLVTLIYKRPLDELWDASARALRLPTGVMLLGRSRGKKRILVRDYVNERVVLSRGDAFQLKHVENAFSQPNAGINAQMLDWVDRQLTVMPRLRAALELYGGVGNFTWVLALHSDGVVMTELSQQAVQVAQEAFAQANMSTVAIAAMDSAQVSAALSATGEGTSLVWQGQHYDFDLVLVDPPRAGLDAVTQQLVQRFDRIIYISCNPETLVRDLNEWSETHDIQSVALFDQFPYTHHIEMGVVCIRR